MAADDLVMSGTPGHQQPWYWPSYPGIIGLQQLKGQHIEAWKNGSHVAEDIFKIFIYVNGNHCIWIQISMESVLEDPINNISS